MNDPNQEIAALLLDLSEVYRPTPRYWGYKNASRSIRRHPAFLSDLTEKDILKIPGVGPATLRRNFLSAAMVRAQHAEIDTLNKKLGAEFRVFKGVEANILQDGTLRMSINLQVQNLTNRANFTGYSGTLTSLFYGKPTQAQNARRIMLGMGLGF